MFAKFKYSTWKASLLATIVSLLTFTFVLAASGDLDTTFSGDGLVTTNIVPSSPGRSDMARDVAIQANGKIIVVGDSSISGTETMDFAVARYKPNGILDTTFSGDGRLITSFGGVATAFDVAIQSNGRIVVVGYKCTTYWENCRTALARYKTDGTLDTSFSGDGKQITGFGKYENLSFAVGIQPDGKIVVAGDMFNGTDYDFAVYRYLSNGSLDTTFAGDGKVNFDLGTAGMDTAFDLALQIDGKIVVAGRTCDTISDICDFAIARLNADGSLDTTFSGDGKRVTNLGADDRISAVALQMDGKIVAIGDKDIVEGDDYFAIVRYNSNGSLDKSFNSVGKRIFSVLPGKDASAKDVVAQPDGKIVGLGTVHNDTLDFALVRLNSDGSFDTAFSENGNTTVDFGGSNDYGTGLALQSNGVYILAGYINDGTQEDFALVRVLP